MRPAAPALSCVLLCTFAGCFAAHDQPDDAGPLRDAALDAVEPLPDAHRPDACVASPEICNGVDDDCDAIVDEGSDASCDTGDDSIAWCGGFGCHVEPCDANRRDCDGDPANACEIDISADRAHCGGCGIACAMREACVDGACVEDPIVDLAPAVSEHSCMALRSGRLLCWGRNSGGAFASEPMDTVHLAPRDVDGIGPVDEVAVGYWSTCIRDRAGDVMCAGWVRRLGAPGSEAGSGE